MMLKSYQARIGATCFNKLLKAQSCPLQTGLYNHIHKGLVWLRVSIPPKFLIPLNPGLQMKSLVVTSDWLEFSVSQPEFDTCITAAVVSSFDPILVTETFIFSCLVIVT